MADSKDIESATTAIILDGIVPDSRTRRYDRQLRLWAASGQSALEHSRILVLSSSATSSSILKNLVLPGIGHFTILDKSIVTPEDAGNNFFLEGPDSIGKSRAEETVHFLAELNEGVDGRADTRELRELLNDPKGAAEWLGTYTIVIAHNLDNGLLEKLSTLLWEDESLPPLVVVHSAGFLAEFAIQFHEHTIIESHLESSPSLRIDKAFPALRDYALSLDFQNMDPTDHSHIPYVVILVRVLEEWRNTHNGLPPQTYPEKQAFKAKISSMKRKFDEENVEEAESQAYRCWTTSAVPSEISALLSDPRLSQPALSLPPFFRLLKALKKFTERHDILPLTSTLPDMKANTEEYVKLQRMYKNRAAEEKAEIREILVEDGGAEGVDDVLIDQFVKNAHRLKILNGRKWGTLEKEKDGERIINALESSPKQAATHFGLSALQRVLSKRGNTNQSQRQGQLQPPKITIEELTAEAQALLPSGASLPETEWNEVAGELVRAPTADLPNSAAFLGGLVAQEVIKMITKQYVPVDGICVIDLIETWTGVI
ncbi:hypothetical protein AMATHDRAFT_4765 [Amanita thiersii Skay4041]|uniref:NEDD8-activating enzyme E1 regulatory subunit n=1 Tax=Amanita thiersii Skay4041 TaxID=703135 RepID=A0A2A9NPK4_9AGAR|nr:hypothetical protein AMATHDRAFT_4765 [Amanita thiersii Skay4041]